MSPSSDSRDDAEPRPGRLKRRLLAVLLGLALVPVALELALQAASLLRPGSRAGLLGGGLVLCQGDSNTFGLNLPEELSYPAQLEALLRERGVEERVVNRGVPGKPTWVARDELEEDLVRYDPRAVVFFCGINDRSMVRPETRAERVVSRFKSIAMARRIVDSLRLRAEREGERRAVGLIDEDAREVLEDGTVRMRFRDRADDRRAFDIVHGDPERDEVVEWIAADLAEAATRAREAGVVPLLVAYPAPTRPFEHVNEGIEEAARRSGATLVDVRSDFAIAIERLGEPALLFRDGHPTAIGYGIVARAVLGALVDEGVVDVQAPPPLSAIEGWTPPELTQQPLIEDGRAAGVRLHYAAGYSAQVLLAAAPGSTRTRWRGAVVPVEEDAKRGKHYVPLEHDARFEATWRDPEPFTVYFDAAGDAEVRLPGPVLAEPGPLYASAVVVAPRGIVVEISEALKLR